PAPESYMFLSLFFTVTLGLAMVFYFSVGRRVISYLIADWLIFWSALGAVATLQCVLLELKQLPAVSRALFSSAVIFALIAVVVSRGRVTIATLRALRVVVVGQDGVAADAPPTIRWTVK